MQYLIYIHNEKIPLVFSNVYNILFLTVILPYCINLRICKRTRAVFLNRKMQRAMLQCNGVQTQVITEGRWVEEGLAPNGNKHVVLVIPGNPGVPEFYESFIKNVKARLPTETPVWIVGHAGHVQPPDNLLIAMPDDKAAKYHYDLSGQLQHKVAFIDKYVPKDAKIHIIGHSIGSWFALNLLRQSSISNRVVKCYMLFPTIERMAESPNGKFFRTVMARIAPLLYFLAWIFTLFPIFLQVFCIRAFGFFYGIPSKDTKAVLQLVKPPVLKRVFNLAKEEMKFVRELDHDLLNEHAEKLWFYYGTRDGWVPVEYYHGLVAAHPNIEAQLCKCQFQHSFTLKHSKEIGSLVGNLINENINSSEN